MTEPDGPYRTLAVVIRTIGNIGDAGSTDLLHLDTGGHVHLVSNQQHCGTSADSTRQADIASMIRAARDAGVSNVVMDLSRYALIGCTEVEDLVSFHRQIKATGGEMVIAGAAERIVNLLSLTQLDRIFKIVETLADAAEYYRARSGAAGT